MESDIVSGQQSAWVLLKKLGEGDAGEVYLVESLLEKQTAILKRPGKSAFASDIIRQTAQITTEGKILKTLSTYLDLEPGIQVNVPRLLDQSKPGTAFSDRLFIVIEKAPGFDLSELAKASRMGLLSGLDSQAETPEARHFLQTLSESSAQNGSPLSERIVLNILHTLLEIFERIHNHPFDVEGVSVGGILWNDVKPEHLFWDPLLARLTIIDWGNGQFLEKDGTTKDRRYTIYEDYRQFIEEMGRFMELASPDLIRRLAWPSHLPSETSSLELIASLREKIWEALQQELDALSEARRREMDLLRAGNQAAQNDGASLPPGNPLAELAEIHRQIITHGELPDYASALHFAHTYATLFADHYRLDEIQEICEWAIGLPGSNASGLRLVSRLAQMGSRSTEDSQHEMLREAVRSALKQDWGNVLWGLVSALRDLNEPNWWPELLSQVRRQPLGEQDGDVQPLLIVRRTLLTLQSMLEKMQDQAAQENNNSYTRLKSLVQRLREEIVPNWVQLEPAPPYSNLLYQDIDEILEEIGAFLPDARYNINRSLEEPRRQVQAVLECWENGDFENAANKLRDVILWDPDRKRVLRAEKALQEAPQWLAKVHQGPQPGEHYQSFATDLEFEGRELRNQVGPAGWLDLILEGCRQLRRGVWPPDLFTSLPLLVCEMPWLKKFERLEKLPSFSLNGDEEKASELLATPFEPVVGVVRGKLGLDQDLHLLAPLDAWIAEARGSSARVFSGMLRNVHGEAFPAAIKLMRMDKVDYSLPLFREEALVLNAMSDVPGISPMYECGFIKFEGEGQLPTEREASMAQPLSGSLIRIGPKYGQEYINQIENRIAEGWTPYLALLQRDPKDNLLNFCDAGMTGGNYPPVADLLQISIQICDILIEAHQRNIVYRDHKILHYYWLEEIRGVYMIDWNVARLHPEGLTDYEKQMDLVQFGARALHHILTGRTAPGALPLGPTRPEEIEQAAKSYEAQWTYDDQRLPEDVLRILERVLAGEYNNAEALREDLKQSFLQLPDLS